MNQRLIEGPESLSLLYGDFFYIFPEDMDAQGSAQPVVATAPTAAPLPQAKTNPNPPEPKVAPTIIGTANKPGITWRPKPNSKVLFVLQNTEFKDPNLTDLLKKIVDSLGIAPEFVGFGQIDGQVHLEEFDTMPNPYAIVFDPEVWGGADNPVRLGKGEVFFSRRLEELQNDAEYKRHLWAYLKALKEKIN